jgi:hypothetical protein
VLFVWDRDGRVIHGQRGSADRDRARNR